MNNISTILDAVGELDNTVLDNAFKPRKKKPVALIVIAAAAALSLLVGFTTVIRNGMFFEDQQQMSFNYYPQAQANIPTEEELIALGAVKEGSSDFRLNVLLSELFKLYNIAPLMNSEFFSEEPEVVIINSLPTQTIIEYTLTDKESAKQTKIKLQFKQTGDGTFSHGYHIIGGGEVEDIFSHYETIALADGSEGFVADRYLNGLNRYTSEAVFCYNGIGYQIQAQDDTDINEMKLMLKKLGVTAE